jgi:hypothetical protein
MIAGIRINHGGTHAVQPAGQDPVDAARRRFRQSFGDNVMHSGHRQQARKLLLVGHRVQIAH